MAPVLLDPSGITVFAELLSWHMKNGTRFSGTPESLGNFWTDDELAEAVGVEPQTVKNWADGIYRPLSEHLPALEHVLFGNRTCYRIWKAQFRHLWREARTRRRLPQTPAQPAPVDSTPVPSTGAVEHLPHTAATRRLIDVDRLPGTPYVRLAGRGTELAMLDTAFRADSRTKILSIIAWGGSGKTALVNAWLEGIRSDAYREADAVLGWSFYKQGTEDRAASSDLFLTWALASLDADDGSVGPTARGEALARLLQDRHILLILDGIEALQFGPGPRSGDLKDLGLRTLLRRFAADAPQAQGSLILLTSRLPVSDIARWEGPDGSALLHRLEALSPAAGAELLRDNGVHGTGAQAERQLQDTAREFGGHPLALSLLAVFLRDAFGGDVRSRDRIGALLPEDAAVADENLHGHARRVMRSIQTQWLSDEPVFHAIMDLVGLFDRPATPECLAALTEDGGVPGLSDTLAGLPQLAWSRAVARLRRANLLLPEGDGPQGSLDAHPLVREWFGEGLRRRDEGAWRRAHARLYAHLRQTREGEHPSREDLEPLYRAIVHGCRAGLQQSALMDVYGDRICRQRPNADISNYAGQILGAVSENLAAVSAFFVEPYETVHPALDDAQRHWVLSEAAFGLREAGRLAEAVRPQRHAVKLCAQLGDWIKACIGAYNLSEIHQYNGELARALDTIAEARSFAEEADDPYWRFITIWYEAQLWLLKGAYGEATERMRQAIELKFPASRASHLTTTRRLVGCTIDLRTRNWVEARRKAAELGKFSADRGWRLPFALATLYVAQSEFGRLVDAVSANPALGSDQDFPKRVGTLRKAFDRVLDALAATDLGSERPRGHLARARFRIAAGDWTGAALDLDETYEIAGVGPMRLYLADAALLRCRLAVARTQGFAPLALAPVGRYDPEDGISIDASSLLDEARGLIWQCGYFDLMRECQELAAAIEGGIALSIPSISV